MIKDRQAKTYCRNSDEENTNKLHTTTREICADQTLDGQAYQHYKDKKYRKMVPEELVRILYHCKLLDKKCVGVYHHRYIHRE